MKREIPIPNSAQSGFTLIELILYIVLVTMMLGTLIPFAWNVIEGGVKVNTEQEVYSQGRYVSEVLKRAVRDASAVTTCNATTLVLTHPVAAQNPITVSFASNVLTIRSGTAIPSPVRIHSTDTRINSFNCTNYTGTGTDNVQINFTIASDYSGTTRKEYNESLAIQLTAETRE